MVERHAARYDAIRYRGSRKGNEQRKKALVESHGYVRGASITGAREVFSSPN